MSTRGANFLNRWMAEHLPDAVTDDPAASRRDRPGALFPSAPCVVAAQEALADVAMFATDLDTPGAGREFCVGGHFLCALHVH
ncbi:DUF768 domain-containing protein [Mesorhizobium sp. B2-3-13]|nr:DUF768 domain-containing protein [Mesorhizobium sp. B2-3-13]